MPWLKHGFGNDLGSSLTASIQVYLLQKPANCTTSVDQTWQQMAFVSWISGQTSA